MNTDELSRQAKDRYLKAMGAWRGCDWPTAFGPGSLDLNGLLARQTRLLVEATSGAESESWAAATLWLEQVESDARDARLAAQSAVALLDQQHWGAALSHAKEACDLEAAYHTQLVWGPLRDLIAEFVVRIDGELAS